MDPSEVTLVKKHIRSALFAIDYPPAQLPRLDQAMVERTIDRIGADKDLGPLFARIHDGDALRRTFLSVYYQTLNASR